MSLQTSLDLLWLWGGTWITGKIFFLTPWLECSSGNLHHLAMCEIYHCIYRTICWNKLHLCICISMLSEGTIGQKLKFVVLHMTLSLCFCQSALEFQGKTHLQCNVFWNSLINLPLLNAFHSCKLPKKLLLTLFIGLFYAFEFLKNGVSNIDFHLFKLNFYFLLRGGKGVKKAKNILNVWPLRRQWTENPLRSVVKLFIPKVTPFISSLVQFYNLTFSVMVVVSVPSIVSNKEIDNFKGA